MEEEVKTRSGIVFAFVLLLLGVLLPGCAGIGGEMTGEIALTFSPVSAKTIDAPIVLVCASYSVSGTGPSGKTFGPVILGATGSVTKLIPGPWTITAVGFNGADGTGDAIGSGTGTVTVVIGQPKPCAIEVVEYAINPTNGNHGTFTLNIEWEPRIVMNPVMTATVAGAGGGGDMVFPALGVDPDICVTSSSIGDLHAGWYSVVARLYDRPTTEALQVLSSGFAEVFRIAAGRTTTGDVLMHAVQGEGSVDVNITPNFATPLALTPSRPWGAGNTATVYDGQANPFEVTADKGALFTWYLRGQQIDVSDPDVLSDSIDLDASTWVIGESYRLDCLAFSTDGKSAGSGSWTVVKQDAYIIHYHLSQQSANAGAPACFLAQGGGAVGKNFSSVVGATEQTLRVIDMVPGVYHLTINAFGSPSWTAVGGSATEPAIDIVFPAPAGVTYYFDFGDTEW
jgi:hypothetical protein